MLNIFLPELITQVGLSPLMSKYKGEIFLVCLASWVILIIALFRWLYGLTISMLKSMKEMNGQKRILAMLAQTEKEFLKHYIDNDTDTNYAEMSTDTAGGLEAKGVIFRSSMLGISGTLQTFPYNLQPWAKILLKKYPKYLQ